MNQSFHASPTGFRVVGASLLSALMLLMPVTPILASTKAAESRMSSRRDSKETKSRKDEASDLFVNSPAPIAAPTITATKTDTYPSSPGPAVPGETVTYTVDVNNTGPDPATGMTFMDTIDPNTTLVGGSLKVSPIALNDTYSAIQNTPLVVAAPGVLTNDTGLPAPTAVPIVAGPTTAGGTVTLNADGSFTYNPPNPSFVGADTFTYTATNTQAPPNPGVDNVATVTINVDAAPTVTTTTPTNGATNVATNTNITVNFSEAVNATTSSFTIECPAPGNAQTFTVSGSGTSTIVLDPTSNLPVATTCTVTVIANQISDTDSNDPPDNMAANYVFSFTTQDAAPSVTTTTPTNGATGVPVNSDVVINFSEAVNVSTSSFTIECPAPGNLQAFAVTGSGTSAITLNPNSDLPAGVLCTVTVIASQVADTDAIDPPDNMAANFVFSFTTDAAPTVTVTTPTNGATQVANNTNISVTFSEGVNATTSSFTISCATTGSHTFALSGGPTTFTLDPDTDFANGELCTVTVIAAQVTDTDANDPPNNMAANFVFSFTIDNPPSVTTTTPTNGATGVAANTNIVINFSESVNATLSSFQIECPAPGNTQTFTLSASPATSFTLDPVSNLPIGVICTVTVFAAQITDADSGDPPDNMAANYVFSFSIPPDAVNDARSATGNIRIQTAGRSEFSVLTNDIGPGITVTAFDATSVKGGNVSVSADGKFTYNPPPGYTGADTFNYTITNLAGSDTASVTINISNMIWFIDDSASSCTTISAATGCGRLTNPLSTMAAFEAANGNADVPASNIYNPAAGDNIFIYSGNYTAPLTLEANQRVIGEGATSSLQTLSGVTPATDSDTLPSTGGTKPSITSSGNGFNVVSNNQLYGLAFSNTTGTAINSNANVGTFIIGDVTITNSGAGAGMILDDGGTSVTSTGINTISTNTATALSLTNATNIGAADLTYRSISSTGSSTNGIVLNNTGSAGGLIVAGNGGTCTTSVSCTGGAIQNKTVAISLTNTQDVSLTRMFVQNTTSSGIFGTTVTNFTLQNSVVDSTGTSQTADLANSALFFGTQLAGTERNLSGTVTITNNSLTNMYWHGISIVNFQGTISNANISNNTVTSPTSTATSKGSGIQLIAIGTASQVASVTTATINANTVSNFPSDAGVMFQCGNANVPPAPSAICGSSAVSAINITSNIISGQSAANRIGTQGILATFNGSSTGNLNIDGNTLTHISGNAVSHSIFGVSNVTSIINNNTITPNQPANSTGSTGINVGTSVTAGFTNVPVGSVKITNNTISNTDGNGILATARDNATGTLNVTVKTNNVAAPLGGVRPGIRVDAGNASGDNDVCLDIASNTSAGSGGSLGIGLRKQGTSTTVNAFGIEGMAATSSPGVEAFVTLQNPAGGGTFLISATSGFSNCSTAPNAPVSFDEGSTQGAPSVNTEESAAQAKLEAMRALVDADPVRPLDQPYVPRIADTWNRMPVLILHKPESESEDKEEATTEEGANSDRDSKKSKGVKRTREEQRVRPQQHHANLLAKTRPATTGQILKGHAANGFKSSRSLTPASGETVNHTIGTLPAGKSVRITFQVTIDSPYSGGANVSNQGSISYIESGTPVLTDDPDAGGAADPTLTPVQVQVTPSVVVNDAKVAEPTSGSTNMVFTVALSAPAGASGASVNFQTSDGTAKDGVGEANQDYTSTSGMVSFTAGQQVKTINVPVLSDADNAEVDETFTVTLSTPVNVTIADGTATGTITVANPAGAILISELRTSGPGGLGDDFVEIYNNSDTPHTVAASDGSAGYGLFKMGADCDALPVLIGKIPNGTVIPARGHYLFVGSQYSLKDYGGTDAALGNATLSADIESDRNVALFTGATKTIFSSVTRLDAVGFGTNTGSICDLFREGTTLPAVSGSTTEHTFFRKECDFVGGVGCTTPGYPKDTNDNAADFKFADTQATAIPGVPQQLGAPGPQNLLSPLRRDTSGINVLLLDAMVAQSAHPNRSRDFTSNPGNNSTFGTLTIRRRVQNSTGGNVTRLRYRVVEITTLPITVSGRADVRLITSVDELNVGPVNDAVTCTASGAGSPPCSVTVKGTTLEQPPAQSLGGGFNSSGTVTLGTPLANGASINVRFLLGVQQPGSFRFLIIVEALP